MAVNAIPVDQRVIDIDSRRFASIEKALVELVTNSDDSYTRLEQAGERIAGFAGHQGLATDDVADLLELRRSLLPAGQVVDRTGRQGAQQLAAPIPGSAGAPVAAVVLHVPAGPDDQAGRRRWTRALVKLAAELGEVPAG